MINIVEIIKAILSPTSNENTIAENRNISKLKNEFKICIKENGEEYCSKIITKIQDEENSKKFNDF